MNDFLISRPFSVRIGMFCKFGLFELKRPVAVTVCIKLVCMRPSILSVMVGNGSTYVLFNLRNCRYCKIIGIIGWSFSCFWRISSEVAYCPVLVFFAFADIFKTSNKISPNCFGESTLKSIPASALIPFSNSINVISNCFEYSFNPATSMAIPSCSISFKTSTKGISMS